jgi:hypothetical protein
MKSSCRIARITIALLFTFPLPAHAEQRPFLMGTSVIAELVTPTFEYLGDKDLLSLHLDDFEGIPWTQFRDNTTLPASWESQWESIRSQSAASGKILYLAVSPLKDRKTLAANVDASGTKTENWAPVDGSGCYAFATDPNAEGYKQAYINYLKYLIDRIHPTYLSPTIEMNLQFKQCPAQSAAFKQWYADVHHSLKEAYPNLVIFPTFQAENMYGISDTAAWCGGTKTDATLAACFEQRLTEALTVPGDRIAFSMYPFTWLYPPSGADTYTPSVPYDDMFNRVERMTQRKIWISETGWPAVRLFTTYQHAAPASACSGVEFVPTPLIASDAKVTTHLSALLAQAQTRHFEAVVWWEDRDLIDATIAATCPCSTPASTTCQYTETLYLAGSGGTSAVLGSFGEITLRIFANMGLRNYNGTSRTGTYDVWASYLNQTYSPVPGADPNTLTQLQVYPNPMRPSQGHTGINFNQLPPNARVRVYTLAGEKVKDLSVDATGHSTWDGKNESGRNAASGVYIVYIQGGGQTKTVKVAIQR